jgi:hypothetical protein
MKKRIDTEKLSKIVKDRLQPIQDKYEFSPKTKEAFDDMLGGISEMVGDLEVIKEKENDVVVDADLYADEYISNMISTLEAIIEDLEFLKGLSGGEDFEEPIV